MDEPAFCPRCATPLAEGIAGDRPRRLCPACGWVHWDNPTPVVAAIIELDGRILLARNRAWPAGWFALVTGFLERGESAAAGVQREVREETALEPLATTLVGVYEHLPRNQLVVAFHVQAQGEVRLSEELADYRLLPPERLRPWPASTGHAVADWLRARGLPVNYLPLGES